MKQFGKGWGEPHLRAVRQFYLIYRDVEKRYTLCSESEELKEPDIRHTPRSELISTETLFVKTQLPSVETRLIEEEFLKLLRE